MKNSKKQLLIIGHQFPEPKTTAAGFRMMQLIQLFRTNDFEIIFATSAAPTAFSEDLDNANVRVEEISLNDSLFDQQIRKWAPDVVLFDRFMTEEQFGWRVAANIPEAIRILDTEDLHFLRRGREAAVKENEEVPNLFTDLAKRELASIFRCDLSLIISEAEMDLLSEEFKVPEEILFYLPICISTQFSPNSFEDRNHFAFVGNMQHAPNLDAVKQLRKIWPTIRKILPEAECHIFGAYFPKQLLDLHRPDLGFIIKGWIDNVAGVYESYRVLVAPIRFGAGLKGKIIEAFSYGMPVVTTEMGAEGISGKLPFGGSIVDEKDFAKAATQLFSSKETWETSQKYGLKIIEERFNANPFNHHFLQRIQIVIQHLETHRNRNFFGRILEYHAFQSTKYMSRWIEEKNKNLKSNA
ncbi:MAG TPA: glycosyltransferase [Flavobacteriaceae bacterium]|nr:glycosyltransferase [Flavobacteriaceae bacterium]